MSILHLVLGLALVALGTFAIVRRKSLPLRPDRKSIDLPPTGWGIIGALFIANGAFQLMQALT